MRALDDAPNAPTPRRYEGLTKEGLCHVRGVMTYGDTGETYAGEFGENSMNGLGEYRWSDGSLYQVRDCAPIDGRGMSECERCSAAPAPRVRALRDTSARSLRALRKLCPASIAERALAPRVRVSRTLRSHAAMMAE